MFDVPDHPDIACALRTGYPTGHRENPVCPICGSECETIYIKDGTPIGCDECIDRKDAADYYDDMEDY